MAHWESDVSSVETRATLDGHTVRGESGTAEVLACMFCVEKPMTKAEGFADAEQM